MKNGVVWLGFGVAAGLVLVLLVAIMVVAWSKGGMQAGQMVEIPVNPATLPTGGA